MRIPRHMFGKIKTGNTRGTELRRIIIGIQRGGVAEEDRKRGPGFGLLGVVLNRVCLSRWEWGLVRSWGSGLQELTCVMGEIVYLVGWG